MFNILLASSIALLHYIASPTATLYDQPAEGAEIVSQAFYSEAVNLLKEEQDWVKIATALDGYQGWMRKSALIERSIPLPASSAGVATIKRLTAHLYGYEDTIYGPIATLPYESRLELLKLPSDPESRWLPVNLIDGRKAYVQRGDVELEKKELNRCEAANLSLMFLGLPYTWGGRSSFGYDCSGFVQMLYRQMGIFIPRDAQEQLNWSSFEPISWDKLQTGDLIFFGFAEDKIKHVGFFLGKGAFIHTSPLENAPYLRISHLNDLEWNGSGRYNYRTARTLKIDRHREN